MQDIINTTWPVGKIFDIKLKVKEDSGVHKLLNAMNGNGEQLSGLEILAIGFNSSMDKRKKELLYIHELFERIKNGYDMEAQEELEQYLITNINSTVEQ